MYLLLLLFFKINLQQKKENERRNILDLLMLKLMSSQYFSLTEKEEEKGVDIIGYESTVATYIDTSQSN